MYSSYTGERIHLNNKVEYQVFNYFDFDLKFDASHLIMCCKVGSLAVFGKRAIVDEYAQDSCEKCDMRYQTSGTQPCSSCV